MPEKNKLLQESPCRYPYLFAYVFSFCLLVIFVYILLDAFVIVRVEQALMPAASVNFTPAPTAADATAAQTVYTDMQYIDENIQINITTVEKANLVYHVADIKLSSLQYFKTAFANDQFGQNILEITSSQAKRHNAILAINGDYYGFGKLGLVIRDGTLYRDMQVGESLVLMQDGKMRIVDGGISGEDLVAQGALHAWSFGPVLVVNGVYVERYSFISGVHPRTGIGMIEPYHYVFIVVDGRSMNGSNGITMQNFAKIFIDLDCQVAYNLDGGGSATMVMHEKIVNKPCYGTERGITDIIYIGLE